MRNAKPQPDLIREIEGLRVELERSQAAEGQTRADLEAMSQRLQQLTSVDPLTQTLSRQGIEQALATELKRTRRSGMHPVAILLDCDNFKRINRRFGHGVGDAVLAEIAGRIRSALRASDHIARLGVDEFLLLLPDTGYWEAVRIAERIRLRTIAPVGIGGREPQVVETSLGVCMIPDVDMSLEEVVELAQAAVEKSRTARVTDTGGGEGVVMLLSLQETYRAVREPIISLTSGAVAGYEILARSGIEGFERPDDFLGLALAHNVLTVADLNCLKACLDTVARAPETDLDFHINLFPSTILNTHPERLLEAFGQLERSKLCVEITEQQFFADSSQLKERLTILREGGIRLAIDDVGFGRSSLELLILLAPDVVKIDQRFVKGVSRDPFQARAFRRLLDVIDALGATAIAEGVETIDDRQAIEQFGVKLAQGFLWKALF